MMPDGNEQLRADDAKITGAFDAVEKAAMARQAAEKAAWERQPLIQITRGAPRTIEVLDPNARNPI